MKSHALLRGISAAVLFGLAFANGGSRVFAQVDAPRTEAEREAAVKDAEGDVAFTPSIRYDHIFFNSDRIFITAGGNAGTATEIDSGPLDSDDDDTFHAGLDVTLFGDHRIRVGYQPLSFDGETTADRSFIFHGLAYAAGDSVSSTIDLGYRYFDLSMHETTNRADFEGHGPTLSVSITL